MSISFIWTGEPRWCNQCKQPMDTPDYHPDYDECECGGNFTATAESILEEDIFNAYEHYIATVGR